MTKQSNLLNEQKKAAGRQPQSEDKVPEGGALSFFNAQGVVK